jgi:hypothetical protein
VFQSMTYLKKFKVFVIFLLHENLIPLIIISFLISLKFSHWWSKLTFQFSLCLESTKTFQMQF